MDKSRVTSTPSIRVHEYNGNNHGRRGSTSRSAGTSISRSPGTPMAIPNSRPELPPPPLPPPRFIGDIAAGSDPGWAWGNDPSGSFGKSGGSPMAGANFPKSWGNRPEEKKQNERGERPEYRRREIANTTIKSPADRDRRYDFARQQDEGYYSVSGPRPSAMTQQSVYTSLYRSLSRTLFRRSKPHNIPRPVSTAAVCTGLYLTCKRVFTSINSTDYCLNIGCMARDIYNSGISKTPHKHTTISCSLKLVNPRLHLVPLC